MSNSDLTKENFIAELQRLMDEWKAENPGKTPVLETWPTYPGVDFRIVDESEAAALAEGHKTFEH